MPTERDLVPDFAAQPQMADPRTARARLTNSSLATAGLRLNGTWAQPLDVHARLNNLVGPDPLHLEFDCADADFEFAFTSSWPRVNTAAGVSVAGKAHANLREADVLRLAATLNGLVRLYALETGSTNMHVLVEARRGVVGVPPWWDESPCLFGVFAFDTGYSEVGLFSDPVQAFAALAMITTPHRLLLAVGPARPEWTEDEGEDAWLDADSKRIAALKRIEADMSKDIARLMANTVDLTRLMADAETGGMAMEEALMDGLSRVRGAVQKMRGAILGYEMKRSQKRLQKNLKAAPSAEAPKPQPDAQQQRRSENEARATLAEQQTLAKTVRELQVVLRQESASPHLPLPARATFRRGLTALTTLENALQTATPLQPAGAKPAPRVTPALKLQPAVKKAKVLTGPVQQLVQKIIADSSPKKPRRRRLLRRNLTPLWLRQQLRAWRELALGQPARPDDEWHKRQQRQKLDYEL